MSSSDEEANLWVSCHGYESRSVRHLDFPEMTGARKISFGFEFPDENEDPELAVRLQDERRRLVEGGFETVIVGDSEFDELVRGELGGFSDSDSVRICADVSSMNRSRIASLIVACASSNISHPITLDLVYFPATFASHKHDYEPLEYFGPVHDGIAGWASNSEFPLALLIGLGTEPRRADGIVETIEPSILGLFEPVGDEEDFSRDIRIENRRVMEVGGLPVPYQIRDPEQTFYSLLLTVRALCERSRVIIVPLGPKIFSAIAVGVALAIGPEIGVWKASAGSKVESINVESSSRPVFARLIIDARSTSMM